VDKEEFRIKLEEINHLVEKKDYKGAMEIVDSIDWRRVKNVRTLCVVGEIYAANKRYEDSKEIFLLAYHRAPIGKTILYRLIEVSIKMGDLEEAEEFYDEFLEVAPNDNTRYILKYKIYSAKRAPLDEQIAILEEYKEHEYTERWSYELAKLYYKAGEKEKCIDTCDDLILWFSEGKYVTKALDMKMRMGVLTDAQRKQYEEALTPKLKTKEELEAEKSEQMESSYEEPENVIESIPIPKKEEEENAGILEATGIFQEKIAKGIKEIFSGKKKEEDSLEENENTEENIENMLNDHQDTEDVPELEPEEYTESQKIPEKIQIPEGIRIPEPVVAPKPVEIPKLEPTEEEIQAALEADKLMEQKRKEEEALKAKEEADLKAAVSEKRSDPEDLEEEISVDGDTLEQEEASAEDFGKTKTFDFNLEDTILAAASAQGIELPEGEPIQKTDTKEVVLEASEVSEEEVSGEIPDLEPEEVTSQIEAPKEEEVTSQWEEMDETEFDHLEDKIIQTTEKEEKETDTSSEEELLEQFIDSINPDPQPDPLYLIPRDMKLDDSEKKLFSYFASIPGIPEQLVDALADVQQAAADKTSKTGNVIIMGATETGKTRLSQGLILAACRELHMEAAKIATITGDVLNEKEPAEVVNKLSGGFIVIEDASRMTAETIEKLNQAMEFRTDGLTVIIEDEKIGMRKLIAKYPKFAEKFTSMINIPVFTNDELVTFAKVYTKENGYVMDQMGVLALYNLIGDNQKEDEPMTIGKVKELIDDAISRAESGTRKFKRNLSKKRMDEDGRVILYEKDFG
jgi:tetratricopeptide (TPR) repeat protein